MPRSYIERGSALRTIRSALDRGVAENLGPLPSLRVHGTVVPHSWKLKFSGNCTDKRIIFRDGVRLTKGANQHVFGRHPDERPVLTELEVPCRKCENCLRRKAAHWRLRAYAEWSTANRTWFGTLTLSPEQHFRSLSRCRMAANRNGDDFDMFDPERQFQARHRDISLEITRYVKRIRKESSAELRFLCVVEAHKTGLPHYHMLVHEVLPTKPIRHATLKSQWTFGFTDWKLVTTRQSAGYVTKYLAKSSMARVRASLDYGNPPPLGIGVLKEPVKNHDLHNYFRLPPGNTVPGNEEFGTVQGPTT